MSPQPLLVLVHPPADLAEPVRHMDINDELDAVLDLLEQALEELNEHGLLKPAQQDREGEHHFL
ncbi:MAG: hypothetical protein M0Z84_06665 [Gammaproteobacteria bacterium]|nr:hypothetical protein [Gammaproteobacteria bacterium]